MNIKLEVIDNNINLSYDKKIIFSTIYKVQDYSQNTFNPDIKSNSLDFKFIVSS